MGLTTQSQKLTTNFLVLLPFLLIFGGTVFQNTYEVITSITKMLAFFYMIIYISVHQKININLVFFTLLFLPFLAYGIYNNPYNMRAAYGDGIRYLFPIVTLFYSFSIRKHFPLLMKFIIIFIILNFLIQIINYVNWLRGVDDQWFYYTRPDGKRWVNKTAGFMRATGTVVFFSLFGFINLISFFLIQKYYHKKHKIILLAICLCGLFLSFSYKGIATFFIVLAFYYYKHFARIAVYLAVGALLVYVAVPHKINNFARDVSLRISLYITEGNSARSESYRVMFDEIKEGSWLGKGVGVFGGPASTQYHSPYYQQVKFNWYDTKWMGLTTTDTYPPHAFVELGTLGGLFYFLLILSPLYKTRIDSNYKMVLVIYFCLMFDMLVSFSLNNLEYLFYSLVFVYPIFYYFESQKTFLHAKQG